MNRSMIVFTLLIISLNTLARDVDRDFKRGPSHERGNEHSERVNRLSIGKVAHGGDGCPQGTMQVVFAPDNLSFSLLFDQFVANIPTNSKQKQVQMSCDSIIPIEIPDNTQMEITRVDYRGFAALGAGDVGKLDSSFNFQGTGGGKDMIRLKYDFKGPMTDNYEISTDSMKGRMSQTEISPCGGNVELLIHNHIQVKSRSDAQVSLTIDSIDGSGQAIYYVNWSACNGRNNAHDDHGPHNNDREQKHDRPENVRKSGPGKHG